MKKIIALLLVAVLCLSLASCGSNKNDSNVQAEAPNTNEQTETVENITSNEYTIGEAFGTDNVECVITEIKWITPEVFDAVSYRSQRISGENYYRIDTEALFPNSVSPFGYLGCLESKILENYFLLAAFSLRNTGKEIVQSDVDRLGALGGMVLPYGSFAVVYDDGYTFDCGEGIGFTATLAVLGDAIETVGGCVVPKQVFENEDKPLKIKVVLPNANGASEEFIVSIR